MASGVSDRVRASKPDKAGEIEWLSIGELAERHGVNKSSISRRVARFEVDRLVATKREGGRKLIDASGFERVCAKVTDAVRQSNGSALKRRMASAAEAAEDPADMLAVQAQRAARNVVLAELATLKPVDGMVRANDIEAAIERAEGNLLDGIEHMREVLRAMPTTAGEGEDGDGESDAGAEY